MTYFNKGLAVATVCYMWGCMIERRPFWPQSGHLLHPPLMLPVASDRIGTTPFVPSDQQTSSTRSHSLHAAVCVRSLHAAVCVHMCGISGTLPTLMLTSCSVALHCTAHTYTTHAHTMHAQSTTAAQQTGMEGLVFAPSSPHRTVSSFQGGSR